MSIIKKEEIDNDNNSINQTSSIPSLIREWKNKEDIIMAKVTMDPGHNKNNLNNEIPKIIQIILPKILVMNM